MIGLAFLHGWGYASDSWSGWGTAFNDRPTAVLDAGYFGARRYSLPDNSDGWVGIGHSLGFARLLDMNQRWRGLVGLGAFLRFCQKPNTPEGHLGTPSGILDTMIERLETDPADVLARFMRRCGQRGARPGQPQDESLERLRSDLSFLRDLDLRQNVPPPLAGTPVLLLHAADDRIAPVALAEEAATHLPLCRLVQLTQGGHALPFTNADVCIGHIQEFLRALA